MSARQERARVAWDTHARLVWADRAAAFQPKPDWVKENWAKIADIALRTPLESDAAREACRKWIELEERGRLGQSWEAMGLEGQGVWLAVVRAVRALRSAQS